MMYDVRCSEADRWCHRYEAHCSISLLLHRPIGFLAQINREQSPPDNVQIAPKMCAKYPKGQRSSIWSLCKEDWSRILSSDLHNRHFNSWRIEEGLVSNMETNYISKQQKAFKERAGCQEQERKGRFVKAVVSENKRFLFTPPNGCEHFLNIACGGCIRKEKGLAVIVMAEPSHLIYDL